jgi:hypothetical protein
MSQLKQKDMSTEKLTTTIGDFVFVIEGYPTKETAQKLFDALDFQRACQAYLDRPTSDPRLIKPVY